jgi:diguanylate cyclase (GGDEF)-like protein
MKSEHGLLLVVDDDEVSRIILCRRLERRHHSVITAESAARAMELIEKSNFDVVLVDIHMKETEGLSLLRKLREKYSNTALPVIMVTSDGNTEGIVEALNAGANDFVMKPIDFPVTIARVHTQLLLRRTIAALEEANQTLQRISSVDGLTGIANRRRFDEILEREWRRAIRASESISVIMIDVDFFKAYHDTYGHMAGDEALENVAGALAGTLHRPADLIARYGGEEFVAVLPQTEVDGAAKVGESMRAAVEALGIDHEKAQPARRVTISVGVASTVPERESSSTGLIVAADRALYRAKEDGRNRVRAADSPIARARA